MSSSASLSPRSTEQQHPSPLTTLTHEYSLAVQTTSYNEIWSKIHVSRDYALDDDDDDVDSEGEQQLVLEQVLQPNRDCVEEALRHVAEPNNSDVTLLVSDYFRHSEDATRLCLLLHRSVFKARALYAPLHQLLGVFDSDDDISLNQTQCTRALDIFSQFDRRHNPFPSPDAHNFDDTRLRFSDFSHQLDRRLRASRAKSRRTRRLAICLIGTAAVAVLATAAAITTHAVAAAAIFAGVPLCGGGRARAREISDMRQVDAAAKGSCVLSQDLATIDSLARRLHTEVEGDKQSIRLGLERGAQDKHPIQEVLKLLRKRHHNLLHLLDELDQRICLCFNTINRARSLLLREIYNLPTTTT